MQVRDEVEVQEDEEVEQDNEVDGVDAGRRGGALPATASFPPIATHGVAVRGSFQGARP